MALTVGRRQQLPGSHGRIAGAAPSSVVDCSCSCSCRRRISVLPRCVLVVAAAAGKQLFYPFANHVDLEAQSERASERGRVDPNRYVCCPISLLRWVSGPVDPIRLKEIMLALIPRGASSPSSSPQQQGIGS